MGKEISGAVMMGIRVEDVQDLLGSILKDMDRETKKKEAALCDSFDQIQWNTKKQQAYVRRHMFWGPY